MEIRDLCADLTVCEYIPTHSRWQSDCGRQVKRFALSFPCVLNDMCIKANQLIFSTEQHVFIYAQYLLTQSASQV